MLVPNITLKVVREKNHDYKIHSSNNAFDAITKNIRKEIEDSNIEIFGFVGMETNNRIVFVDDSMRGTVNEASVYIAEIARKLLLTNCSQVILFHNHPSGNLQVSDADIRITEKIKQALNLFSIKVLDHLILSTDDFISFKELGHL